MKWFVEKAGMFLNSMNTLNTLNIIRLDYFSMLELLVEFSYDVNLMVRMRFVWVKQLICGRTWIIYNPDRLQTEIRGRRVDCGKYENLRTFWCFNHFTNATQ